MMVDDSALISFDSAEIACLFWLQVEAYRQACRLERENAGEGKTASSAAHGSSITTTQASSSHNAPVHNGKISSLGWPGSTWVANAQPILGTCPSLCSLLQRYLISNFFYHHQNLMYFDSESTSSTSPRMHLCALSCEVIL